MLHVNTSPLQSLISRTESHIIIASFISDNDLSMYILGQNFTQSKLKEVGTLINIKILTLMEHEQENTIQDNKRG